MSSFDLISDTHAQTIDSFGTDFWYPKSDVLVIAGDFIEFFNVKTRRILKEISSTWDTIIWVPGNHEFYHKHLSSTVTLMRRFISSSGIKNIFVSDRAVIRHRDVHYVCCTLWSDIPNDPMIRLQCESSVCDYHYIIRSEKQPRLITCNDTTMKFRRYVTWLTKMLEERRGEKVVVVTHHAPSFQSTSTHFRGSNLNYAFASNLEDLIEYTKPSIWVHGHVHNECDYTIHNTRVVCHPQGYPMENYQSTYEYVPLTVTF